MGRIDFFTTSEGSMFKIKLSDRTQVNDAKAIATNVEAEHGIIHIIDTVVIPEFLGKIEAVISGKIIPQPAQFIKD
ncbi:MAG: fasciclin domain-containing protein [Microcoleus sp.]